MLASPSSLPDHRGQRNHVARCAAVDNRVVIVATVLTVREIWRFPVKSMGGERVEQVTVSDTGIIGDRAWGVRDEATGMVLTARREPRLLMADEPGTALDVTTQAQILKLLKDLVEERNLALLMITHNLGVVRETSNYVYVMHNGRIVEEAATDALFATPREAYTKSLIAAVPRLSGGTDFLAVGAEG